MTKFLIVAMLIFNVVFLSKCYESMIQTETEQIKIKIRLSEIETDFLVLKAMIMIENADRYEMSPSKPTEALMQL